MASQEKTAEKIASLLVLLGDEATINEALFEAKDIAIRVLRSKTDPTWLTLLGAPHYTKRLKRVSKCCLE